MSDQSPSRLVSPEASSPTVCGRPGDPCAMCRGVTGVRIVASEELLQGRRELFIVHKGQVYRLLLTRNDKLILQK